MAVCHLRGGASTPRTATRADPAIPTAQIHAMMINSSSSSSSSSSTTTTNDNNTSIRGHHLYPTTCTPSV